MKKTKIEVAVTQDELTDMQIAFEKRGFEALTRALMAALPKH